MVENHFAAEERAGRELNFDPQRKGVGWNWREGSNTATGEGLNEDKAWYKNAYYRLMDLAKEKLSRTELKAIEGLVDSRGVYLISN